MPDTSLLAANSSTSTGEELTHIVCCDDDMALCGEDVSDVGWDDKGPLCVKCEVEWVLGGPCPVTGCVRGSRG